LLGVSDYQASKPIAATALVIDLRNFTPNLKASKLDEDGVDEFCSFLAEFHAICIDAAMMAMPETLRDDPPVHMASTGDGMIIVFLDEKTHFIHGYLAALLLHKRLEAVCHSYNAITEGTGVPHIWYGIGVESGSVSPVRAGCGSKSIKPSIHTVLGNCINVASRAQGVTKLLAGSRTIVAGTTVELLTEKILGTDFKELKTATSGETTEFEVKTRTELHMGELNHRVCLKYLHLHNLKGVDKPVALYRVSESALQLGNDIFGNLLSHLVSEKSHLETVVSVFRE